MGEFPFRSADNSSGRWQQVEQEEKQKDTILHDVILVAAEHRELRRPGDSPKEPYYQVEGRDVSQETPGQKEYFVQWIVDAQGNRLDVTKVAAYKTTHPSMSMKIVLDHIDPAPGVDASERRIYYGQFIDN